MINDLITNDYNTSAIDKIKKVEKLLSQLVKEVQPDKGYHSKHNNYGNALSNIIIQ